MTARLLILTLGLLTVALAAPSSAGPVFWGFSYEVATPLGDARDFVDDPVSWRGVGMEARKWTSPNLAVGVAFSWQVFHESKGMHTISLPGVDITGRQNRDINAVPLHVGAFYYLGDDQGGARPFFGLNAGATYVERRADIGIYAFVEENWHLSIAPEVGVQLPYWRRLGYVSVRWHHAFEAGDVSENSYLSFRVGFGLR
jgi:hypothetical protein